MISNETKINMTLNFFTPVTAYAYEGLLLYNIKDGTWHKSKQLNVTFDKQEALQHYNYRLADSDEVLWWAGASDCEMPEIIECADGLFQWIEPGYDIVNSGMFKI